MTLIKKLERLRNILMPNPDIPNQPMEVTVCEKPVIEEIPQKSVFLSKEDESIINSGLHGAIQWHRRMEWREICNCLYIGVLMTDMNGLVVFANAYLENMLDYPQGHLVGKHLEDLMPQRFRDKHEGLRAGYMREKSPRAMARGVDLYCVTRHGDEVAVQIGLAPMNIEEGTFVVATLWRKHE